MTDVGGPGSTTGVGLGHRLNVSAFAGFWSSEFGGHLVHEVDDQFPLSQTKSYALRTSRQDGMGQFTPSNGIYPVGGLFQMGIEPSGHIGGNLILVVAGETDRAVRLRGQLLFDKSLSASERLWASAVITGTTIEVAFPLELKIMAVAENRLAWTSVRPSNDSPVSILVASGSLVRCEGIDRRLHERAIKARKGRP